MSGLIHLYCGDGKGKTTAALGLGLRASGSGSLVLLAQFLKTGNSSERRAIEGLPNFRALAGGEAEKFVFQMDDGEKEACRESCMQLLENAFSEAEREEAGVLILDELCAALTMRMVDKARLFALLKARPEDLEIVITGRDPLPELVEMADYVSEVKKVKHPFDRGVAARRGIEF